MMRNRWKKASQLASKFASQRESISTCKKAIKDASQLASKSAIQHESNSTSNQKGNQTSKPASKQVCEQAQKQLNMQVGNQRSKPRQQAGLRVSMKATQHASLKSNKQASQQASAFFGSVLFFAVTTKFRNPPAIRPKVTRTFPPEFEKNRKIRRKFFHIIYKTT